MGFSAGFLIYSGIMPLLKMFLTIFFGFALARKGLFPASASRGASQVTMNIALPGLIFSSVVPAFTQDNVAAMGPLFLSAFFYMGVGAISGLIIREICYVPRNFWQGIIVATALSNWGNLPTAIVITVTKSQPFDADTDPALGVSFVAIFIVSYNIVMWIVGAANSLSWDYAPGVPQGDAALARVGWREKPMAKLLLGLRDKYAPNKTDRDPENPHLEDDTASAKTAEGLDDAGTAWHDEKQDRVEGVDMMPLPKAEMSVAAKGKQAEGLSLAELETDPEIQLARRASRLSTTSFRSRRPSAGVGIRPPASSLMPPVALKEAEVAIEEPDQPPSRLEKWIGPVGVKIVHIIETLFTPITMAMYVSLICALIPQLKALFVASDDGPQYIAPDGNPPLNFLIQTAELVGNITVPMALILLGVSFARMKIPKPFTSLPLPAILAVTCSKLVLLPVIGILFSQGLVSQGIVSKEALVERFVGMLLSGTPTAVNQLVVTQLYTKDPREVDTLCAFLLAQYVFMFISTAVITAVSLALL